MLRLRELIPPLTIRLPDGRTVRAWDFKQKKSQAIAFLDADCAACENFLRSLSEHAASFRAKEAVVLVAFLEPPSQRVADTLPDGILAGADVTGKAARAFLGEDALSTNGLKQPAVFVTDRYGELAAQWFAVGDAFPAVDEILGCLGQIEIACEECSPTEWNSKS